MRIQTCHKWRDLSEIRIFPVKIRCPLLILHFVCALPSRNADTFLSWKIAFIIGKNISLRNCSETCFMKYSSYVWRRISFHMKMPRYFLKETQMILTSLSTCIQSHFFCKLFLRRQPYLFKLARLMVHFILNQLYLYEPILNISN